MITTARAGFSLPLTSSDKDILDDIFNEFFVMKFLLSALITVNCKLVSSFRVYNRVNAGVVF